ncbi:MAG: sulfotransferase family 2 domain-containing protein [Candidatus Sedimenticola sp. PURPLELP]
MNIFPEKPGNLLRRIYGALIQHGPYAPSIPNEAINLEKKVIFIAIPKTGTTSIRNQVRARGNPLIPNPHLNIIQARDALYIHLLKEALGNNRDFPSQHIPTDAELRSESQQLFDSLFKFSAVRNPWARAVSLYFRREGIQVKERKSFEKFCEQHLYASDTCTHPTLHKNQMDWLCDETGKNIMDYVYKLEEYETAIKEINEQTNHRLRLKTKMDNMNPKSMSQDYRELYSDKARKIIGKHFEIDIDYFKYTF